jgi:hypothetical protein
VDAGNWWKSSERLTERELERIQARWEAAQREKANASPRRVRRVRKRVPPESLAKAVLTGVPGTETPAPS